MDDQERIAALERALRDASDQRDRSQRRAAQQAGNAAVWQQRAEERAERINRVVAERDRLKTLPGWLRARVRRAAKPEAVRSVLPPPTTEAQPTPRPIAFPTVNVAALVTDPLVHTVLAETNVVQLGDEPHAFDAADLVVVEGDSLAAASEPLRVRFEEWMVSLARAPLVLIEGDAVALSQRDVATRREWVKNDAGDAWLLPTTFDAVRFNPQREFDPADFAKLSGIAVSQSERGVFGQAFDGRQPWMLAAAATGFPFLGLIDSDDALRRGVAGRRIAFRDGAPWIVASALLDRAGVGHEATLPSVAGILVSKRPDRVGDAIAGFAAQSYTRKELVVGCHGFTADAMAFAVAEFGETLSIRIIEFDATQPLGQCLNAAIETTSAQLIAKIDDDDFYGPHYLEDAIQANRYAGAALIGKGATFTYLENLRETLLRSPKTTDRFYNGSPVGASLVFERSLWELVRFPHRSLGEDRLFIAGAKRLGIRPYATSPFEFVYYRGVGHNTWPAVDEVFLEGAVPAWQGFRPEMAVIDA